MGDNRTLLSGDFKKFVGVKMNTAYIKLGWIKLKAFAELTGITEASTKQRMRLATYPAWRLGSGMIKKLRDGYYINYEEYQKWVEQQPTVAA